MDQNDLKKLESRVNAFSGIFAAEGESQELQSASRVVRFSENEIKNSMKQLDEELNEKMHLLYQAPLDYNGTGMFNRFSNFEFVECRHVDELVVDEQPAKPKFSLKEVGYKLVKSGKIGEADELIANFIIFPKQVIAFQKEADAEFVTESLVFRVKYDGGWKDVEVKFAELERVDLAVSRSVPQLLVKDRTIFNEYLTELRLAYSDSIEEKRQSVVEGFVKDKSDRFFHTSSKPNIYLSKRTYPKFSSSGTEVSKLVEEGLEFVNVVGNGGDAVHAIFVVAHVAYAYPFLAEAGLRPLFLALLEATSGAGKTGISRELFNLFVDRSSRLVNINCSSQAGAEKFIARNFRHETAVIDDVVSRSEKNAAHAVEVLEALTRMVGDDGMSVKATGVDKTLAVKSPEAVCVITAEAGLCCKDESTNARHFRIRFKKGDLDTRKLAYYSENPWVMQGYFFAFIKFLERNQDQIMSLLVSEKKNFWDRAFKVLPDDCHGRVVQNYVVLGAVNMLIKLFHIQSGINEEAFNTRYLRADESIIRNLMVTVSVCKEAKPADLFVKYLNERILNGSLEVVDADVVKKALRSNPTLDLVGYGVRGEGNGHELVFLEPNATFKNFTQWLDECGHIIQLKKTDFPRMLLDNDITLMGDSNSPKRKVPGGINGRERWLAIYARYLEGINNETY